MKIIARRRQRRRRQRRRKRRRRRLVELSSRRLPVMSASLWLFRYGFIRK